METDHVLYQRFKDKTWQEIQIMIAELTPIEETRVGQDLIEKGIEQGIEKGEERILIKWAKDRFAEFDESHEQQIRDLNSAKLSDFADAFPTFRDLSEMADWLKKV